MSKTQREKVKAKSQIVDMLSGMYTRDSGIMVIVKKGLSRLTLAEIENLRFLIRLALNTIEKKAKQ